MEVVTTGCEEGRHNNLVGCVRVECLAIDVDRSDARSFGEVSVVGVVNVARHTELQVRTSRNVTVLVTLPLLFEYFLEVLTLDRHDREVVHERKYGLSILVGEGAITVDVGTQTTRVHDRQVGLGLLGAYVVGPVVHRVSNNATEGGFLRTVVTADVTVFPCVRAANVVVHDTDLLGAQHLSLLQRVLLHRYNVIVDCLRFWAQAIAVEYRFFVSEGLDHRRVSVDNLARLIHGQHYLSERVSIGRSLNNRTGAVTVRRVVVVLLVGVRVVDRRNLRRSARHHRVEDLVSRVLFVAARARATLVVRSDKDVCFAVRLVAVSEQVGVLVNTFNRVAEGDAFNTRRGYSRRGGCGHGADYTNAQAACFDDLVRVE